MKVTIKGIIVLIWLFASFFAIVSFGGTENEWLIWAVFGQLLFIGGIVFLRIVISGGNFRYVDLALLLFPIAGAGLIVGTFIIHYGREEVVETIILFIPYAILGLFVVAGLYMVIGWFRLKFPSDKGCTEKIKAICKYILEEEGGLGSVKKTTYCPVFEFYFNGNTYTVCNNVYTKWKEYGEGGHYNLFIDPREPQRFCVAKSEEIASPSLLIMGLLFVIIPIIMMVLYSSVI